MRFEKENNYIEIESVISTDNTGNVYIVGSSLSLAELPIEFREQVKQSDTEKVESLKNVLCAWAIKNGYTEISYK